MGAWLFSASGRRAESRRRPRPREGAVGGGRRRSSFSILGIPREMGPAESHEELELEGNPCGLALGEGEGRPGRSLGGARAVGVGSAEPGWNPGSRRRAGAGVVVGGGGGGGDRRAGVVEGADVPHPFFERILGALEALHHLRHERVVVSIQLLNALLELLNALLERKVLRDTRKARSLGGAPARAARGRGRVRAAGAGGVRERVLAFRRQGLRPTREEVAERGLRSCGGDDKVSTIGAA